MLDISTLLLEKGSCSDRACNLTGGIDVRVKCFCIRMALSYVFTHHGDVAAFCVFDHFGFMI